MQGPKKVPRVDYERIFVLDEEMKLLGEYALRDDCPLEYDDLKRLIPISGLRHLVSVYQGEYAFTPFRVERRESTVAVRETRAAQLEADVKEATANVRELDAGVRAREMRVDALRDYAVALQRAFRTANGKPDVSDGGEENPPPPDVSAPPP